ncbi:Hypothetical_protein [Hexamita inflata]|uniref:Hypothetical_protein n=1 Tax=Hexamita inflata TaxID=28002 RepID=A0AA86QE06_9EUKA|nr:Hypothetical protein HINF_LOCUS42132 [Hexamita inflata]
MKTSTIKHPILIPTVLDQLWNVNIKLSSNHSSVQFFEALASSKANSARCTASADSLRTNQICQHKSISEQIQEYMRLVKKMTKRTNQLEERLTNIIDVNVASLGENNRRIFAQVSRVQ